jgi:hypothetical protein
VALAWNPKVGRLGTYTRLCVCLDHPMYSARFLRNAAAVAAGALLVSAGARLRGLAAKRKRDALLARRESSAALAAEQRASGLDEASRQLYEGIARSDRFTVAAAHKAFAHLRHKEPA